MGKVPTITDTSNGFTLAESHAIMRYLTERHPENIGNLYPKDNLLVRAKIDEYLDFHHTNTRKVSYYVFNLIFAKQLGIPTDPQYIAEEAKKVVERALTSIEKVYLQNGYIVGDNLTLADLSAYYEITFLFLA